MSNWTAASSDCSRPANNYVRVNTVDLYTPNARFTQERLGYQVLTLFGKLGYSPKETKVGNVFVSQSPFGLVELRIGKAGRGSRYADPLTVIDAKRLAYALLLAADEVASPKSPAGGSIPSAN